MNSTPLEDIRLFDKGQPIPFTSEEVKDLKYIGLSNWWNIRDKLGV